MPPKTKKEQPSKKQQQEKKQKIVEDKTFGMKNKKGAKAQKFIQQVQKQVQNQGKKENEAKKAKDQKLKEQKELAEIFKPVMPKQKFEAGVDPKSILCVFFKQGICTKGDKCKFSHDLLIEKKSAKKDIYTDSRGTIEEGENKDEVVIKTAADGTIKNFHICKHFLDAVENNKYGWFWVCPNGGDNCKYKHALPPGYKLKKDVKPQEEVREQTLEELLALDKAKFNEIDNAKTDGTPLTLERFNEWKAKFVKEREKNKPKVKKSTKQTGREMFTYNPDLEAAGEEDGGISIYDTIEISNKQRKQENDENLEIDENLFDGSDLEDLEEELEELEIKN